MIAYILDKSCYNVEIRCKLINIFHLHKDDVCDWKGKESQKNRIHLNLLILNRYVNNLNQ